MFSLTRATLAWLVFASAMPAVAQALPKAYTVTATLQAPAGAFNLSAIGLNELGQTSGGTTLKTGTGSKLVYTGGRWQVVSYDLIRAQATIWSATGAPTVLKPLSSGARAYAGRLNDQGWATGASYKLFDNSNGVAVLWLDGKVIDLGAGAKTFGDVVNNQGWVLGSKDATSGGSDAGNHFVWHDKTLQWLRPNLAGVSNLVCLGFLSDAGAVPCRSDTNNFSPESGTSSTTYRGFVWAAGVFTEMVYPEAASVLPYAMSRSGVVAGIIQQTGKPDRAFVWRDGVWSLMPDVSSTGTVSSVRSVNDSATVLLSVTTAARGFKNLMWRGNEVVDIAPLVPGLEAGENANVSRINNRGQLLTDVIGANQVTTRTVVLTPVAAQ